MDFNFNVRFETIDDTRVKVFVNDHYTGAVTFKDVNVTKKPGMYWDDATAQYVQRDRTTYSRRRLCFRGPESAFKRTVADHRIENVENFPTVVSALDYSESYSGPSTGEGYARYTRHPLRDEIIAIAMRCALKEHNCLTTSTPVTPDDVFAKLKVLNPAIAQAAEPGAVILAA